MTRYLCLLFLAGCGGAGAPASVPPQAAVQVPVTVFIGDSITSRWATELIVPGSVNKGIPGESPCQILVRFKRDVLDLHASRVHILGGTNGLMLYGPREYECVLEMARQSVASGAKTYVGTVPPRKDSLQVDTEYFDARIREAAPVLGFTVVDYYTAMATPIYFDQSLYDDVAHPNAAGYARMEGELRKVMQ